MAAFARGWFLQHTKGSTCDRWLGGFWEGRRWRWRPGLSVAQAQTTYPNVKVTGRLQEQFYYFDNDDYAATTGPKTNFFTRRARIEARGNISENVVVYIQPSFEGGRNLNSVATTCTSSAVPAGGGTPTSPAAPPAGAGCGCGTPGSTCGSRRKATRARSTSAAARRSGPTAATS